MRKIFFFFSVLIFIFGVVTSFSVSLKWLALLMALYFVPVLCQFTAHKMIRIYGLWFGFFLVLQTLISPIILNNSLKVLRPSMERVFDVRGGLPGVSGKQQVTTDFMGFRVTKKIDYHEKKQDVFRIFAIGGSTTEQLLIDDKKTWTHLLQEKLSACLFPADIEVINTGLSGTRIGHHIRTLKEITAYKPDMVIFLIGINDWNHHIMSHFNPFIDISFDRTLLGRAIRRMMEYSASSSETVRFEVITGEDYHEKRNSLARNQKKQFRPSNVSSYYARGMIRIVSWCRDRNITCVFLTQPNGYHDVAGEEYKKGFWMTPQDSSYTLDFTSMIHIADLYNHYLKDFGDREKVPVFDLSGGIPGSYDYMYDDCHFNINGALQVSRLLSDYLRPFIKDILQNKIPPEK